MPIVRTPEGAKKYGKPIGTAYGDDAGSQEQVKGRAVDRLRAGTGASRYQVVRDLANGPVPSKLTPAQQVALYRDRIERAEASKQRSGARKNSAAVRRVLATRKRSTADKKRIKRLLGIDLTQTVSSVDVVVSLAKEFAASDWHDAHEGQTCSRWQHGKDKPKAVACRESGGTHLGACAEHKKEMSKD